MPKSFVALPVNPNSPIELAELARRLNSGVKESQAEFAGRLITETSVALLDDLFIEMMDKLEKVTPNDPLLHEARDNVAHVQDILRKYLGWLTGFVSNERMAPVSTHYVQMFEELEVHGEKRWHLVIPLSEAHADEAERHMSHLSDGTAKDGREGIEALIVIIDEALKPLMYEPKRLMKFNFVVDKTLNGVISVTMTFAHRALRKFGAHISPQALPTLAEHLRSFLHRQP